MKNTKKLIIILISILILLTVFTGCGKKEEQPKEDNSNLIVVDDTLMEPVIDEAEVKAFSEYLAKYDEFDALHDDAVYDLNEACPLARVIVADGEAILDGFEPAGVLTDNYGFTYVQFNDYKEAERFLNVQLENGLTAQADTVNTFEENSLSTFVQSSYLNSVGGDELSWGTKYTNARMFADVLKITGKSKGKIIVAVVDSGCDYNHPFLSGRLTLSKEANFVEPGSFPLDKFFHGTAVSGVVADMTKGLNVSIMPIRAFGYEHVNERGEIEIEGPVSNIINSINYAVSHGASIINLSLASRAPDTMIEKAVRNAVSRGVTVVCSASNEAESTSNHSPARMSDAGVIVVSSINENEGFSYFSNYGSSVDIAAPGENIQTISLNGKYSSTSGTSFSAPYVAGAAAMVKLLNPYYSPSEVEKYLKESVKDLGAPGKDDKFGVGALQFTKNQCFIIDSLEVYQNPKKMEYYVGDTFDGSGMILKAIYNHGFTGTNNKFEQLSENSKYISYADVEMEQVTFEAAGNYTIRFYYGDKYVDLIVTVNEKPKEVFPEQNHQEPTEFNPVMYELYYPEASIWVDKESCANHGVIYDRDTNTVTLHHTKGGFLMMTSAGNGFKIVVDGDCKLDFIGATANVGFQSVLITGSGTLTIDDFAPDLTDYGDIYMSCSGTDSCLMIDSGVTLKVKRGIHIYGTNREKAIFVKDPLTIKGNMTVSPASAETDNNAWALKYMREHYRELADLPIYNIFVEPDSSGYVYIGK